MRLLIAEDKSRSSNLEKFGIELENLGIECKIIGDLDIFDKDMGNKFIRWFKTPKKFTCIIEEFKPDVVLVERLSQFPTLVIKSKIPLIFFLLGDIWSEISWSQKNTSSLMQKIQLLFKSRMADRCFSNAKLIIPICKYLEKIVNEKYPKQKTSVMYQGIDPSEWLNNNGLKLQHPCVGLLQGVRIWGKAKEMLILPKVLKAMPDVMFYWAGSGQFKDKILKELEGFHNFQYLESLSYPDQVKSFLAEIDVFAHISGQDMSPHTLLEAGLMKKPIIATDVGGISESIIDNQSGFLVKQGSHEDLVEKISRLITDKELSQKMGQKGYEFVLENFTWKKIAEDFVRTLNQTIRS